MKTGNKQNAELIRAVEDLKAKRIIIKDKDILDKTGFTKGTLSNYLSGRVAASANFIKIFEDKFGVKVFKSSQTSQDFYSRLQEIKLNNDNNNTLDFYEIGANASTETTGEIIPIPKTDKTVLHISDLFKGSQYAIRISGNSMTPMYPSGAIIGIRLIQDKQITPGSVYVIEKDNDLWIKRLFYKEDDQDSGYFECISDNTMKHESGARAGKLCYPPFFVEVDKVRKLFKVTGIYKANELILIN